MRNQKSISRPLRLDAQHLKGPRPEGRTVLKATLARLQTVLPENYDAKHQCEADELTIYPTHYCMERLAFWDG
jgi:hypothetical protein